MDGLKQRLIGALVLISLAVIFVPMLFDEPHVERSSRVLDIAEEPPFPEVERPPEPSAEPPSYRIEEVEPPQVPERDADEGAQAAAPAEEPKPVVEPERRSEEPVADTAPSAAEVESEPAQSVEFARSLEGAWVVQLGSFGNADNARRLRDNVREKGYDAHTQRVEGGETTFTRVFAGPFADKEDAREAKGELDTAFGVNGLIVSGE
ncbi:SPOR domain-containing protein [Marinobacter sp.]|uniref:SPOR domain-containing protein n=1 Tax=Marinobacter sp. TaxID=50741 RepID=UPI003850759F